QQSDWKALPTAFHTRQFPVVMTDRLLLSSSTADNDLTEYRRCSSAPAAVAAVHFSAGSAA
ncbi:MAG: hypothetical protein WCP53_04390, partial [Verrucomicrobiota bacterium]